MLWFSASKAELSADTWAGRNVTMATYANCASRFAKIAIVRPKTSPSRTIPPTGAKASPSRTIPKWDSIIRHRERVSFPRSVRDGGVLAKPPGWLVWVPSGKPIRGGFAWSIGSDEHDKPLRWICRVGSDEHDKPLRWICQVSRRFTLNRDVCRVTGSFSE